MRWFGRLLAALALAILATASLAQLPLLGAGPGAAVSFTPLALTPYLWLDPSDTTTDFSDSSCTTPASVDGPVGCLKDKSGNNNNAVQVTSGKRPLLRLSGGLYYLDFDGTDDCLQVASAALPTYIYLVAGFQQTNAAPFFIEHSANAFSNDGFWFFGTNSSTWQFHRSSGDNNAAGTATWPGTSPLVGELLYNGTGTYWKNASAQSNGTIGGTSRSDATVTTALNIGSRNQTAVFLQGRLYVLIIAPAASSSLQPQARTYAGAKTGIAL